MLSRIAYFQIIRACWHYAGIAGQRRRMVWINVLLLCSNAVGLSRPIIVGKIVQTVAAGGPDFLAHLELWLGALVGNMIIYWAFIGPVRRLERRFSLALRQTLTERLYDDLIALPWLWHQDHHSGDTLSRLNKAATAISTFADNQFDYLNIFLRLFGSIFLLYWLAPQVGLIITVVAPLLYFLISGFDRAMVRLSEQSNQAEREISATLVDYLGNIGTLLALRLAKAGRAAISQRFAPLTRLQTRYMDLDVWKWALFMIGTNIAMAGSLLFYLLRQSNLQAAVAAGTIVTVFQYLQQIDTSIQGFASSYQNLLRYKVDLAGITPIEDAAALSKPQPHSSIAWQKAAIRDVTFSYTDREQHLHHLDGVSLDLARGRKIVLVGSSGAGKSTLLRVLRGLHEPASGSLAIDGTVQASFALLAPLSTLILQDTEIFENTLRYNIACGAVAGDAELQPFIEMACLEDVISSLPHGLDTDIRERGVNLSGGQKQRLALARGLYAGRDSSLLLLDEPTSSLDAITEARIFERLLAGFPEACVVASLHRLHLLERFDYVYVLEQGRVVEEGGLAELLAVEGKLFALWQAQSRNI
jgi:ABC-type multidrug transport system fused ATPase/permease subunit